MKTLTIIGLIGLSFIGLIFIVGKVKSIILHFRIRKHKKFLNWACKPGDKVIKSEEYLRFRKQFYSLLKLLRKNKNYKSVSLFGQYLSAIRATLEHEFNKHPHTLGLTEELLVNLGYSNESWSMVCLAIKDGEENDIILKQLYWMPAILAALPVQKWKDESIELLRPVPESDKNRFMQIEEFLGAMKGWINIKKHLSASKEIQTCIEEMEKAFDYFINESLDQKAFVVGDVYKLKNMVDDLETNGSRQLYGIKQRIGEIVENMENDFKKSPIPA